MSDQLGVCENREDGKLAPHPQSEYCRNWRPLARVEIWRYNDTTLTVARSDGAAWNAADTLFVGVRHEGIWDSARMAFRLPAIERTFSDGVPVASYDGLDTLTDA